MKRTATASTFIPANPEFVFDIFTHYQTYQALMGVRGTSLIRPGSPVAANGLGAIREIDLGIAIFREQVIAIQRPDYWDYRFIEWPLSFTHVGGRMRFDAVPGGTQMVWESTIEASGLSKVALPGLAWLSGAGLKLLSLQMKRIVLQKKKNLP